ncbi:MAG: FliA/WhiG family RNA polymerase sigma factor [Anaerolineae bacterium]|nr:FliA/WhiG family RNA polymerase sigma factor [Anaerolineae bacterium]
MDNSTELWRDFTKNGNRQAREKLIIRYASLVKYVVGRLALGLPPSLQQEDLIGYGTLGLMEAVDRFDPERGFKFETFAMSRIRGQIIDTLRRLDWLPRSIHQKSKKIEKAVSVLCQLLGRLPTDEEVAAHLEIDLKQYHYWLRDTSCTVVSLDQPFTFSDGEYADLYESLENTKLPTPTQHLDDKELKKQLAEAILALPERERLMISLYYNDELTMKEIGEVLGISESRVSQLHTRAVLLLRGKMNSKTEAPTLIYNRKTSSVSVHASIS